MEISFVISNKGKSYLAKKENSLIGKKIGDKISGDLIGLKDYELEITGGSDTAGFPMNKTIDGSGRRNILVTAKNGNKIRVTSRGNQISDQTAQINLNVLKEGKEPLDKLLPKEKKE